ncbi:M20/M25/M40 family metallo-hydrolase [Microbacterium oryzae]|uniref:M20/M25/M40 family metallo-hydrolase n=1 Tax=Microbacterium oryzae TaxID=743009 RepID=UPI0025B1D9C3|nr:M20/M25/M40 family metallo-hydrolase [Microbacterium oryzae]MDN3311146.1 M20/M25/M40 family metallo-hydrolase [Microbacterium oryzae]
MTIDAAPEAATRQAAPGDVAVADFLKTNAPELIRRLTEWAAIPSVAGDPERAIDVERSARWLAGEMRDAGLEVELIETGDTVAVFGQRVGDPDAPTVLVYSHHDVRAVKPEGWSETDPFTPVLRDGRLYGRGTSDAKGQVMAHLWGLRAHLAAAVDGPALNVKYLVEGEEEVGSQHLADLIAEHTEALRCDVIVFSDTLQWKDEAPAVVTSMRGMLTASLTVRGPGRDVHSGAASGATANPIHVLADVLSAMHDEGGRIAIPGFYDAVAAVTEQRRKEIEDLPFDDETWLERTETRAMTGEDGYSIKERLWLRPSLEVLSLLAGDPTAMSRAVIPATAEASLNIRTVPDQRVADVAEQLRRFISDRIPDTVEYALTVDEEYGQEPYVTPATGALRALEVATERGYGKSAAGRMGNAGGGPADLLSSSLDAPIVFVGTGLPEDHWHASDESVDVEMMMNGAATIAFLWEELAAMDVEDLR